MKKREEEINKYSKERIKILEDGGVRMRDFLVQKDPFPKSKCDRKSCFVCESELSDNPKISCNSNNVGYKLKCETCLVRGKSMVYEGETARSARTRGGEHVRDFKNKRPNSVLNKHKEIEHIDEEMKVSMQITRKFKDPLTRQANEAVRISNRAKHELLNSKAEFNHPPISRVTIEKKKFVKKFPTKLPGSKPSHQNNFTLKSISNQCPGSFHSGMEDHLKIQNKEGLNQKHLSSEQENYLESTLLLL